MNNILITGASSSIGREFLIKNNKKNNLIIAQYNKSKDFIEFIKKNNFKSTIITFQCDLSNNNQINKYLNKFKKFQIDTIIHIASNPLKLIRFTDLKKIDFQKDFDVAFFSIFKILKCFLPKMIHKNKGQVIFVLSSIINEKKISSFTSNYNCLKFALLGMIKSLDKEYAKTNLAFSSISPDMMDTPFLRKIDRRVIEIYRDKKKIKKFVKVVKVVTFINKLIKNKQKSKGKNILLLN
jgi:3-oxoacyl-[acyl-carrier protein] reductase